MPEGPWPIPEDQVSDVPLRMLAAEITREKLFERLHDELPYQSTVETDQWKTMKDGSARLEQTIYVTRESQRKIVLGKGGQTIKCDRRGVPKGNRGGGRHQGASLSLRQGARELDRRSRPLPGNGSGIP